MKPSPPVGPITFSDIQRTSVIVTWKPSESDGGSPIKEYILEAKEAKRASWSKVAKVKPDINSYCVQDLKEKQEYVFRVFAENDVGRSEPLVSETVFLKSPFGKQFYRFAQVKINRNFQCKIVNIFLPINFNICFGCSKEPSH